jgi:cell division protein FtsN
MIKADVDGKQYYRVRMGTYSSADAANDAKADFEKSSKKSALVTKL